MSPFLGTQPWEAPDPLPVMRRELKLLLIEMNFYASKWNSRAQ